MSDSRGTWEHSKTELLTTNSTYELPYEDTLDSLLKTVTNWYSPEEWKKIKEEKFRDHKFRGKWGDWKNANFNATPKEWVSIYRYSDKYSDNWESNPIDLEHVLRKYGGLEVFGEFVDANFLDFGAGVGKPWTNIPKEINLFLLEVNLVAAEKLRKKYIDNSNIKIVTDLNEIKDVRFDFIFSRDVLEHVRYLNEHLDIFYILGKSTCRFILILDPGISDGHVYGLHKDTTLNTFWGKLYTYGFIRSI